MADQTGTCVLGQHDFLAFQSSAWTSATRRLVRRTDLCQWPWRKMEEKWWIYSKSKLNVTKEIYLEELR